MMLMSIGCLSLALLISLAVAFVHQVEVTSSGSMASHSSAPSVRIFDDKHLLAVAAARHVADVSKQAITERGIFHIALSGGSVPSILTTGLKEIAGVEDLNLGKWKIWFADERYVSLDDKDSNYKACHDHLFAPLGIAASQVVPIDPSLPLDACAEHYEALIKASIIPRSSSDIPVFDAVILGMGEDGHTCSLFPGHKLLLERKLLVAWIEDSPKPPPKRVTLTYPVLNASRHVLFLAAGAGKAHVLPQCLVDGVSELPAGLVRPTEGDVTWYVDSDAAARLPKA